MSRTTASDGRVVTATNRMAAVMENCSWELGPFADALSSGTSFWTFLWWKLRNADVQQILALLLAALILVLGLNGLALALQRRQRRQGEATYPLQTAVIVGDVLTTLVGAALLLTTEVLDIDGARTLCFSDWALVPVAGLLPCMGACVLGTLLLQTALCVDRLQGLLRPVAYRLTDHRRRARRVALGVTLLSAALTFASLRFGRDGGTKITHGCDVDQPASLLKPCLWCAEMAQASLRVKTEGLGEEVLRHYLWTTSSDRRCSLQLDMELARVYAAAAAVASGALLASAVALAVRFRKTQAAAMRTARKKSSKWATSSMRSAKQAAKARQIRQAETTVTLVVLAEATLQIAQLLSGIAAQIVWNTNALWGDVADGVTYSLGYVQLVCSFLCPLIVSKRSRTEFWRMLSCKTKP